MGKGHEEEWRWGGHEAGVKREEVVRQPQYGPIRPIRLSTFAGLGWKQGWAAGRTMEQVEGKGAPQ